VGYVINWVGYAYLRFGDYEKIEYIIVITVLFQMCIAILVVYCYFVSIDEFYVTVQLISNQLRLDLIEYDYCGGKICEFTYPPPFCWYSGL